jgi:hypothetical protein
MKSRSLPLKKTEVFIRVDQIQSHHRDTWCRPYAWRRIFEDDMLNILRDATSACLCHCVLLSIIELCLESKSNGVDWGCILYDCHFFVNDFKDQECPFK